MQIETIALYDDAGRCRTIDLRLGGMNVISGDSQTGKSALLEVIDYCFGSDELRVPEGIITDHVSWYALVLVDDEERIFVARPAPRAGAKSASAAMLEVGLGTEVPASSELEPNTNTRGLEEYLTRRLGINENLREPDEHESRLPLAANVSHALFLVLQAQDEIASRRHLFHRQSEDFIPNAIRDTLPYFLGAVEPDALALRRELRERQRELRLARRRLKELDTNRDQGLSNARRLLAESVDAELLPTGSENAASSAQAAALLEEALFGDRLTIPPAPAGGQLPQLEARRRELTAEYRRVRDQLGQVVTQQRDEGAYAREVGEQTARLSSIHLLPEGSHDRSCPLCGAQDGEPTPERAAVLEVLGELDERLSRVRATTPRLEAVRSELEKEARTLREELAEIRASMRELASQDAAVDRAEMALDRQSFVRGKIAHYLETQRPATDQELEAARASVASLEAAVAELEELTANDAVDTRTTSILNAVGRDMSQWAGELGLEYSEAVRIDHRALTVVADTVTGERPLAKIGSAQNWIGYHLVAHLGLHRLFVLRDRPVPRFLFLDQITQAFYPREASDAERLERIDADREAVRAMFALLNRFAEDLSFQVIVTDHAVLPDDWFRTALIEEWRDGRKLVPTSWTTDVS